MTLQVNLPIEGWPYEVSNTGLVYSLPRVVIRGNGRPYTCAGKQLTPWFNGGHLQVELHRDGEKAYRYVHVLVLEAHVGPRPTPEHKGLHWDDNPYHNHVSNLYWGTMSDNAFDRVRNGNDPNARKFRCDRGHDLVGANLAPWATTGRVCLACNRAHGLARYRGHAREEEYIQQLADEKYAVIMGQGVVP